MCRFLYRASFLVSSTELFLWPSTGLRRGRERLGDQSSNRWRTPRTIFLYFMTGASPRLLFIFSSSERQNEEFTRHGQPDIVIILFPLSKRNVWGKDKVEWFNYHCHNTMLPFHLPNTKDSDHQKSIKQIYSQHPLKSLTRYLPISCRGPYL